MSSILSTSAMAGQAGMAQSQRAAQDVQDQSRQIDSLKRDLTPTKDKPKKLREACEGFESVFIQKMWEQMRATVPKGNLLQGRDEQYWQGMFDQELSKKMSSAGGIGLADMMYEQLSRNLISATRTTASGAGATAGKDIAADTEGNTGFVASAAPLLPTATTAADSIAANTTDKAAAGTPHSSAMYTQEAHQPEGDTESQRADTGPAQAASPPTPTAPQLAQNSTPATNPAPAVNPPEVQQVLDQLRAQMGGTAIGNTMTGAQAIAAVQSMTPAQALALSQGMSWSQVQGMNGPAAGTIPPELLGQSAPSGLDAARAAAQTANTRMPSGGVLPPMTAMQRQAQMNYSAAKVQGSGGSSRTQSQLATSSTMPLNPTLQGNVQGTPGVAPHNFVQNGSIIPVVAQQDAPAAQAAPAAPMSMTAEQIATLTGAPQPAATAPAGQPTQAQGAQSIASASPAVPATAQEPQIINTTFTTNIPPARRSGRQGQRMAKGQPAIRTLNAASQG